MMEGSAVHGKEKSSYVSLGMLGFLCYHFFFSFYFSSFNLYVESGKMDNLPFKLTPLSNLHRIRSILLFNFKKWGQISKHKKIRSY